MYFGKINKLKVNTDKFFNFWIFELFKYYIISKFDNF